MINRDLMVRALQKAPDPTSVIRFVDNFYRAPVEGDFPVEQTTLPEKTHASVIIPALTLRRNSWLRWVFVGTVDYGGGAPDNFRVRFRWGEGGPVMLTTTATVTGAGSNLPWHSVAEFQCSGPPGPATQIRVWLSFTGQPGPTVGLVEASGTFDTSKKTKLLFTMELASSSGTPVFRTLGSYMETF